MKRALLSLALLLASQLALAATDYKCMSDCTSSGYQYSYCKRICSY
jgi:hypothetical protein